MPTFVPDEGASSSAMLQIRTINCADNAATNDQPGLDSSLDFSSSSSALTANINVDFTTIATSPYWTQEGTAATQGTIEFCARLFGTGTGVNFDLAKVTVALDLTGDLPAVTGYRGRGIPSLENSGAVDVGVSYPIKSYSCDDSSVEVAPENMAAINQCDSVQFCVESDSAVAGIAVTSILTVTLSQTVDGILTEISPIENAAATVSFVSLEVHYQAGCLPCHNLPPRPFLR